MPNYKWFPETLLTRNKPYLIPQLVCTYNSIFSLLYYLFFLKIVIITHEINHDETLFALLTPYWNVGIVWTMALFCKIAMELYAAALLSGKKSFLSTVLE